MANYVLLNKEEHANIKVICTRAEQYGDRVKYAMTFPFEFRNIQGCYPIFFSKNAETGEYFPLALFGFEGDENLFLNDDGWHAHYVPVMIRRQPFLIGFQNSAENPEEKTAIVTIDMDNPRVNENEGEALFFEHGGSTEFLQQMTGNLELIHQGHKQNENFVAALQEFELIEPFTLDIELNDGSSNQLLGFYTIKEEALQQLDGDQLGKLNEQGFLQPLFMIVASHSRLRDLIELKNTRSLSQT
jgi:hypothetical protein